ncbi:MAG: DUF3667 domain-containing protein [Lewinellaceae bacterium]|nr:DUF3667 domain-containing protein [Lewinellaceae bacterium]
MPYKAKFCAHCGQKNSDGKVSVGDVLQQLWFRILHLESRSWRVLWRLFVPAQVSLDYFSGKRKRYPPPVQFFFIIMFFFLFLLNHSVGNGGFHVTQIPSGYHIGYKSDKSHAVNLYAMGQDFFHKQRLRDAIDSLPPEYRTTLVRSAVDSLLRLDQDSLMQQFELIFRKKIDSTRTRADDSVSLGLNVRSVVVSYRDFFTVEPEQIIQNYQFTYWFDQLMVTQHIKAIKDPGALVRTFIGSLAWTLLALVALMSGVLTLLYRRQKRYYVEHFIYLLHEHTSVFLLLTIALSVHEFFSLPLPVWMLLSGWLVLATLFSMRRYYRQGWILTFVKWSLLSFVYTACFFILFVGGILVAFILV